MALFGPRGYENRVRLEISRLVHGLTSKMDDCLWSFMIKINVFHAFLYLFTGGVGVSVFMISEIVLLLLLLLLLCAIVSMTSERVKGNDMDDFLLKIRAHGW